LSNEDEIVILCHLHCYVMQDVTHELPAAAKDPAIQILHHKRIRIPPTSYIIMFYHLKIRWNLFHPFPCIFKQTIQ